MDLSLVTPTYNWGYLGLLSPFSGLSVVANEGLVAKGSPNLKRFGILLRGLTQEGNPLPGNSASFSHLFWDGENVTLSKVVGDLQRSGIFQGHGLTHLVPINCWQHFSDQKYGCH